VIDRVLGYLIKNNAAKNLLGMSRTEPLSSGPREVGIWYENCWKTAKSDSTSPKGEDRLRYIDPKKVKLLIGNAFPYRALAKMNDIDFVGLNNEAIVRMVSRGTKPNYLAKEHQHAMLGIVDEMERYNRKLILNPELMRERSFNFICRDNLFRPDFGNHS